MHNRGNREQICPICNRKLDSNFSDDFYRCNYCLALVRRPDQIINLVELYQEDWASPLQNIQSTGGTTITLAESYVQLLLQTLGRKNFLDQKILDFGAGKGEIVDALIKGGAIVHAYEPFGNSFLEEKGGSVYRELDQIQESNYYDGITNIDVIEHVPDPINSLNQMKELLKPGGWLYTATPNNQSLNANLTKSSWREAQNPGHLCLFSSVGLELALKKAGFAQILGLKWFIKYTSRPDKLLLNRFLTTLKLDGELRYLSRKPLVQNETGYAK